MSITITKHMSFKSGGKSLTVYRDTDKNFYVTCDGLRSGDDIMTATFGSDFTFVRKHDVPCELLKGQYISSEHFPIYGGTVNGKKGFYFRPAPLARLLGVRWQYGSDDLFSATLVGACDIFDRCGDSAEEFHYCRLEQLETFLSAYIKRLPPDSEYRLRAFNVLQWLKEEVLPRYFDEPPDVTEFKYRDYMLPQELLCNRLNGYVNGFRVIYRDGENYFDPTNLSRILGTIYSEKANDAFKQAADQFGRANGLCRLEKLSDIMTAYLANVPTDFDHYTHGVKVLEWLRKEVLPPDVAEFGMTPYELPREIFYNDLCSRSEFFVATQNGKCEFDVGNLKYILGANRCSHVQEVFKQAVERWGNRLENLTTLLCDYMFNLPSEFETHRVHGGKVLQWLIVEVLPKYCGGKS